MITIKEKIKSKFPKNFFDKILPFYRIIRYPHFPLIKVYYEKQKKPLSIDKIKFFVPPSTSNHDFGKMFHGYYENNERKFVKKFVKKNDCILELGGCLGVVSNTINRILKNPENHIVLEPNPEMLYYLKKNKRINKSKFTIVNKIISTNKENIFNISDNYLGSSLVRGGGVQINVEGCTINDLQNKYSLKFTTLVMDIEGAELNLLKNIKFKELIINKIIFETHQKILSTKQMDECFILLRENKFKRMAKSSNVEVWCL